MGDLDPRKRRSTPGRTALSSCTTLGRSSAPLATLAWLVCCHAAAQTAQSEVTIRTLPATLGTGGAASGVEEVVVTARHRSEKAQKVPIALTAVSAAKLDATDTTSITQLEFLVPTLQVSEFNPRNTSFNIRGVGNNVASSNDGLEAGVGVYVDGVLYARPGVASFDLPDIADVEVLRGPQGTLFGKNTTAGAIDVHSKLPSFTPDASFEASVGNYGYWQFKGDVSDGITDKAAARVSFLGDARNGTITGDIAGQHYGSLDDKAVRVQVLANPTDDLTLRFIADYAHQFETCCVNMAAGVFTNLTNGTLIPYDFYQREAFSHYFIPSLNPFTRDTAINDPTYFGMETGGFSLQADYDLDGYTLTSLSAWRFWNWWPQNGATTALGLQTETYFNTGDRQNETSQEFRITSPTGGPVDFTAGAYFFYQDLEGQSVYGWGDQTGAYYEGPKYPVAISDLAFNGFRLENDSDPVTNSYAGYGQATWHVLPKLDLTGGLRYTYEDKSGSFYQFVEGGASVVGLPAKEAAEIETIRNSLGTPLYYKELTHNGALSYLTSATYIFPGDIIFYASYARGNKSAGVNVAQLPSPTDAIVKPERLDDYEIGLKTSWFDHRLVANADAFWIEDSDYQGINAVPVSPVKSLIYIASVPKVKSQGFEVDSHARPFDWLTLNFAGGYTYAIYESYPQGQCPPEVSGSATEVCNLTGKTVPGTSRWVMSAGGEITQPIGSFGRYDLVGYLGADFSLRSNYNVTANDSIYGDIPGYGLLDLRLGARTADGKYDLYLWSHNATNTNYYLVRAVATPFSGLLYGNIGDPLTFGATLKVKLF
jgi:iron complex outermembrane receptor protein